MTFIMSFVGLGILALFVKGVLCQGQPEPECDLVLGGALMVDVDERSLSFFNTDEVKIVRSDESTAVVTGSVILLKEFKGNYMARVVVNRERMGKTQMAMSYDICDFCAELKNEESQFKLELDALTFPRECPFEPGKFDVLNLTVNTQDMPINAMNEGEYEALLCIYEALDEDCKEVDLQGCVVLPFSIECS